MNTITPLRTVTRSPCISKSKLSPALQLQELKSRNILDGWQTKFSIPGPMKYQIGFGLDSRIWFYEKNPGLIPDKSMSPTSTPLDYYINCAVILDMIQDSLGDNSKCCLIPHNEAATESMFIIPILRYMGWNTMDPCEVNQEYGIGRKKVDYALRLDKTNKMFIEVKNFNMS